VSALHIADDLRNKPDMNIVYRFNIVKHTSLAQVCTEV